MALSNVRIGDRIKVVDTYEGEVTHADNGTVTIGNRYCLSVGYGNDDDPEGLVRTRETTMVKPAVPDILPVGTVVYYKRSAGGGEMYNFYVQTETGWQDLMHPSIKMPNQSALSQDVRAGKAEIRFMP